jgi:hypothetical protein
MVKVTVKDPSELAPTPAAGISSGEEAMGLEHPAAKRTARIPKTNRTAGFMIFMNHSFKVKFPFRAKDKKTALNGIALEIYLRQRRGK